MTRTVRSLAAPFRAVGSVLSLLADASLRIEAVERLSRLTDAQLAARGTTRDEQIRRIVGVAA